MHDGFDHVRFYQFWDGGFFFFSKDLCTKNKLFTLGLVFFLEPCIWCWIWKITTAFSTCLAMFKLNLKIYRCRSISGLANNQKRFKYSFQRCFVCHVLKQNRAAILTVNFRITRTETFLYYHPAGIYLLEVNNRNTSRKCELC